MWDCDAKRGCCDMGGCDVRRGNVYGGCNVRRGSCDMKEGTDETGVKGAVM